MLTQNVETIRWIIVVIEMVRFERLGHLDKPSFTNQTMFH